MDKLNVPQYGVATERPNVRARRGGHRHKPWPILLLAALITFSVGVHLHLTSSSSRTVRVPVNASKLKARCENFKLAPGPPASFVRRTVSDRFDPGTKPVLIKNATIWTGQLNGLEIIKGDLFLDKGIIREVGRVGWEHLEGVADLVTYDADGSWVTPGYVSF